MPEIKAPQRLVATRWTQQLAKLGWTPVADFFLDNYHRMTPPLKYSEAMLVIHIMRHKWDASAPYPAFKTLATRMGISPQAARILARSLQTKGYLHREFKTGETNRFHFGKLFAALETLYAKDLIAKARVTAEKGTPPPPQTITLPTQHPIFANMTAEEFENLFKPKSPAPVVK